MTKQLRAFRKRLASYFRAYGGWSAIFGSPLFWAAAIITSLNYSQWAESKWIETTETLVPSLLGFSLGTYAILFSLINSRLKSALRNVPSGHGPSWLEVINATFFHFIFVQVISLTWAFAFQGSVLFDAFNVIDDFFPRAASIFLVLRAIGSFIGYLLLIYSFLLTIAAALVIYRLATIRDPADDSP